MIWILNWVKNPCSRAELHVCWEFRASSKKLCKRLCRENHDQLFTKSLYLNLIWQKCLNNGQLFIFIIRYFKTFPLAKSRSMGKAPFLKSWTYWGKPVALSHFAASKTSSETGLHPTGVGSRHPWPAEKEIFKTPKFGHPTIIPQNEKFRNPQ